MSSMRWLYRCGLSLGFAMFCAYVNVFNKCRLTTRSRSLRASLLPLHYSDAQLPQHHQHTSTPVDRLGLVVLYRQLMSIHNCKLSIHIQHVFRRCTDPIPHCRDIPWSDLSPSLHIQQIAIPRPTSVQLPIVPYLAMFCIWECYIISSCICSLCPTCSGI